MLWDVHFYNTKKFYKECNQISDQVFGVRPEGIKSIVFEVVFSSLMIITAKTKSLVVTGGMLVMIGRGLVDIIANGY